MTRFMERNHVQPRHGVKQPSSSGFFRFEEQGQLVAVVSEVGFREKVEPGRGGGGDRVLIEAVHFLEGGDARSFQGENDEAARVEIFRKAADLTNGFTGIAVHVGQDRIVAHARVRLEGGTRRHRLPLYRAA